jgi:hypothetical protein
MSNSKKSSKKKNNQSAVKWSLYNNEEGFRRQSQVHKAKDKFKKHKKKFLEEENL